MKRKHLYVILCVVSILVLSLSIAYATLSQTLTISGSADVVASTWDVHIENQAFTTTISNDNLYDYKVQPLLVSHSCSNNTDCIDTITDTSFNFTTASLSKPGDFKAIQFDVVNGGTIDAKLSNYILTGLSFEQDVYLNYYVIHAGGTQLATNEVLKAGERTSMKLVLEFDPNVTENQLPTSQQSLSVTYTMNYTQQ